MGGKRAHPIARPWYWKENDPLGWWKGYDWPSIRRGRQVYSEVFAPCHPIFDYTFNHFQAFMTKEEIKKLASQYDIVDENPSPDGSDDVRSGKPTDDLPKPYPNSRAAQFANSGAEPPDLRYAAFWCEDGVDYIFSLLTGYSWGQGLFPLPSFLPPLKQGQFFNPYMKGCVIAMPPPLSDGMLEYEDGTPATVSQMAKDVCNFLRWTAEPEYDERRVSFWRICSTVLLTAMLLMHQSQKHTSYLIYRRGRYRYWDKAAWGN
mmetsp:Transcript_32346/g.44433  ORF Transcript_32346/g.44433 Transcript_32346/m.44433 type:complete len:261 (-) Transcript_32346:357-1139(-)|eukprot:CAMPEP_0201484594 /NCGR_PEP_ID=MMETSP0151_2-20130828/8757_1 /ASSEMBLY_ACC=CAM_ASM_000257 /TAXON_ID=200890 /ORGANISM="Paramoeba atlantica, Strain 621/1 / CCAP 1560/9" /LENGTH=260 /DNA_ID=CAMNT_0047868325 /DNA_START=50 /DNA_END=832 /DNA_ORIENTATION=+